MILRRFRLQPGIFQPAGLRLRQRLGEPNLLWLLGLVFAEAWVAGVLWGSADLTAQFRLIWRIFFAIGTITPLVVWVLRPTSTANRIRQTVRFVLALSVPIWALNFMFVTARIEMLWYVALSVAIFACCGFFRELDWLDIASIVTVGTVSWLLTISLTFLLSVHSFFWHRTVLILAALFIGYSVHLARPVTISVGRTWRWPHVIVAVCAVTSFALLSSTSDNLWGLAAAYHQVWWEGPAQLVRHGGWLLWDTPSQYGFLNILTVAAMPVASTWTALYLDQAVLMFIEACLLFWMLLARGVNYVSLIFAATVTIGTAIFQLGAGSGARLGPISGPLRWFWSYAMLAVLLKIYLVEDKRIRERWIYFGTACWIVGCLWSAESALYSTMCWLPALASMRYFDRLDEPFLRRIRYAASQVLLMIGYLAVVLCGIALYYVACIHHLPDVRGFLEFGSAYAGGIMSSHANPYGSAWFLLFVLGILAAAFVAAWASGSLRAMPPLTGAFACVWGCSSYYVARSVDTNVSAVFTTCIFAFAIVLVIIERERFSPSTDRFLRFAIAPILIFSVALGFGNTTANAELILPFTKDYHFDVRAYAPLPNAEEAALFSRNGVKPEDRVVTAFAGLPGDFMSFYLAKSANGSYFQPIPWLPGEPLMELEALGPAVERRYVDRFLARHPTYGWIVGDGVVVTCERYGLKTLMRDRSDSLSLVKCGPGSGLPTYAANVPLPSAGRIVGNRALRAGLLRDVPQNGKLTFGGSYSTFPGIQRVVYEQSGKRITPIVFEPSRAIAGDYCVSGRFSSGHCDLAVPIWTLQSPTDSFGTAWVQLSKISRLSVASGPLAAYAEDIRLFTIGIPSYVPRRIGFTRVGSAEGGQMWELRDCLGVPAEPLNTTEAPHVEFGAGFSLREGTTDGPFRWAEPRAQLTIVNDLNSRVNGHFDSVAFGLGKTTFHVTGNGVNVVAKTGPQGKSLHFPFTIGPNSRLPLTFSTSASVTKAGTDVRTLALNLTSVWAHGNRCIPVGVKP